MDKEIIKLQNTKAAIKLALTNKGYTPTDEFSSYSALIDDIPTGNADLIYVTDHKLPIVFPESCVNPILISNQYNVETTEYNLPNAKLLLWFPVSTNLNQYHTENQCVFNIPKCEKLYRVLLAPKTKFITSDKLTDLTYAFGFEGLGDQISNIYSADSFEITNTSNVTSIKGMFKNAKYAPKNISLNLPNLETAEEAFYIYESYSGSNNVNNLVFTNEVFNKPFNASNMARSYSGKWALNISSKVPLWVSNAYYMFCSNAATEFPAIKFAEECNAGNMFSGCINLKKPTLINTENIKNMLEMFRGCTNLEEIPEDFDYSGSGSLQYMFNGCTNLTYVPKINNSTYNWSNMFGTSGIIKVEEIQSGEDVISSDMNVGIEHTYSNNNLRYILIKNLGVSKSRWTYSGFKAAKWNNWGVEDETIPLSIGARQSLVDSLITYSCDRVAEGLTSKYTITLSTNTKALLTEEEIALITAKGYTIA